MLAGMRKTLVTVLAGASVVAGCGGGEDPHDRAAAAATPRPTASPPVTIAFKPEHRSGVTGTAVLAPVGADLHVTLRLPKRVSGMAHIHTGPCSDEPTMADPRIWVFLTDVTDGRSETTDNAVTLDQLQSETSSINVHDPAH